MNYEIVNLEEKKLVGIQAVTSNNAENVSEIIGGLWYDFYQNGVYESVENKANEYAICLYSDYSGDEYCATVGNEVSAIQESLGDKLHVKTIPAGKYAKFSIVGNIVTAVCDAWNEIWEMDLDRSFTGDFEEYKTSDVDNAEIDIYIALK